MIGHSQMKAIYDYEDVTFKLFKKPGALLKDLEKSPEFTPIEKEKFDVAILWMGGNDITTELSPKQIFDNIFRYVTTLLKKKIAEKVGVVLN